MTISESDKYTYDATVKRVVDGDTLDLLVDLGFRTFVEVRVRLYGIDTPECFGVKKESEEYAKGKAAQKHAHDWCLRNREVLIKSHDSRPLDKGKYGRWLAVVLPKDGGRSLNEELEATGHAVRVSY